MWVRLDDSYYDHTKVVSAGPLAELLWVRALAWCNRNRFQSTDGVVPTDIVYRLAAFCPRLTVDGEAVSPADLASALVREGLWVEVSTGFAIHDYTEYQRSLEEIEDLAAKRSAAGRKGAESRWGHKQDGKPMANATASTEQTGSQPNAPCPGPDPSTTSVVVDDLETAPQAVDIPEAVWVEYARLKRSAAKEPVRNIARYDARTIANAKTELLEQAQRWWSAFDLTTSELAAALVDGKAGRYWTRKDQVC